MRIPGIKRVRREIIALQGRILGGGVILGYHRVAHDPEDPHRFCVTPEAFADQLDVILDRFLPVPLDQLALGNGNGRRPLALTFDDGYADVLHAALPLLEARGIPATVFIVSGSLDRKGFGWDDPREGIEGRPLTVDELNTLAASPLVEIGAHTRTHPDLTRVSTTEARFELRRSRTRLAELLDRPIRSFAYPHGGVSRVVRELTAASGFQVACASAPGLVRASTDRLRLPRFWPPDLAGDDFEAWLTARVGA